MFKVLSSLLATATLAAGAAQATPINLGGSETNLQQIVNGLVVSGNSSVNVVTDQYQSDEVWGVNSFSGWGTSLIVAEIAGYAGSNRFGIYDFLNPNNRLELFSGSDSVGARTIFDVSSFGTDLFGFYLETPDGLWFSQSNLNSDQADHMVAYRGEGETIKTPKSAAAPWGSDLFLLGWEDLSGAAWDHDYNDFVVLVGGVQGVSVPEPGTLGLLGLGLAGIGAARRRRKQ